MNIYVNFSLAYTFIDIFLLLICMIITMNDYTLRINKHHTCKCFQMFLPLFAYVHFKIIIIIIIIENQNTPKKKSKLEMLFFGGLFRP
jgi:Na+/H+ antiporter NhaB